MIKIHDREFFHKYFQGKYAIKTLETLKAKWSSPRLFNDPFDVQVPIRFPFEPELLLARMASEFEMLLFAKDDPHEDASNPILATIRKIRASGTTPPRDHFGSWVEEKFGDFFRSVQVRLLEQQNESWGEYWKDKKLFCVAEDHDNLLMWAHYADSHRGAVLRFRCLPERETALCAAMPVIYDDILPSLGDADTWARCVIGSGPTPTGAEIFKKYWLTKSRHWVYEKEWRTITKAEVEDGPGFALLDLLPEEIDSIYLGCRMDDDTRRAITRCLTGSLAHVRLFQGKRSDTHFALEFEAVREGKPS